MKMSRLFFLFLAMVLLPAFSYSAEFHGRIVKYNGDVSIKNNKGKIRKPEVSDYIAVTDEQINTRPGGKAVVKFTNGSMTVIGENSSLGIEKPTLFSHLKGTILFSFARNTGPTRMVQTGSAVFGVRATSFLVDSSAEGDSLALKEGQVSVESPEGEFEIHRVKTEDELEAYKAEMEEGAREMEREGEEFIKKEQADFIEFKRSFLLDSNNTVAIRGNRVEYRPMDEADKRVFDEFEDFAGEFLKDFK